jgi:hypothetical protein
MRLCSLQLKYLNLLASPIRYRGELSDCRNLIFRRNFPIHKLFERSCDLGLLRLSADRIAQVFGWRLHKRLSGKLSSVLEKTHCLQRSKSDPLSRRKSDPAWVVLFLILIFLFPPPAAARGICFGC